MTDLPSVLAALCSCFHLCWDLLSQTDVDVEPENKEEIYITLEFAFRQQNNFSNINLYGKVVLSSSILYYDTVFQELYLI